MALDWIDVAVKAGIPLISGIVGAVSGLVVGAWKWGRSSAKEEQAVKDDYSARIAALRDEMRTAMATQATKSESRIDLLVEQFKETFDGIRRQIDEHRYYTEKDFLKKEDFKDFREEYREDMRDLKASIAGIARTS